MGKRGTLLSLRNKNGAKDLYKFGRKLVEENFLMAFLMYKPSLAEAYAGENFKIIFNFVDLSELELYHMKGRPKRIVDRKWIQTLLLPGDSIWLT